MGWELVVLKERLNKLGGSWKEGFYVYLHKILTNYQEISSLDIFRYPWT